MPRSDSIGAARLDSVGALSMIPDVIDRVLGRAKLRSDPEGRGGPTNRHRVASSSVARRCPEPVFTLPGGVTPPPSRVESSRPESTTTIPSRTNPRQNRIKLVDLHRVESSRALSIKTSTSLDKARRIFGKSRRLGSDRSLRVGPGRPGPTGSSDCPRQVRPRQVRTGCRPDACRAVEGPDRGPRQPRPTSTEAFDRQTNERSSGDHTIQVAARDLRP